MARCTDFPLRDSARVIIRLRSKAAGTRRALVVGTSYAGTAHQISGCEADAVLMGAALRGRGFTVQRLLGPQVTRARVLGAFRHLMRHHAKTCAHVVFFFSGHGIQHPASDDGERDGLDEAILCHCHRIVTDNEMRSAIDACPPRCAATMIFDCCNSGTITDYNSLHFNDDGPHRVTIGACRDGKIASQLRGRGVLTAELVKRLRNGDARLRALHGKVLTGGQVTTVTGFARHDSWM